MTRNNLIEAMARAIWDVTGCSGGRGDFSACPRKHCTCRRSADDALTALSDYGYAVVPKFYGTWLPMDVAPQDQAFFAWVDDTVRLVKWGKTSHVPIYGWCLADQGAEDFDVCEPTCWFALPLPPDQLTDLARPNSSNAEKA